MSLVDSYGRPLTHLRISINSSCNYNCFYCHLEGIEKVDDLLTPSEIGIIVHVASNLGIRKYKLTGGEPLLRSDVVEVVKEIASVKPLDLGMTTNGYYLENLASKLAEVGLMRVNISLPSLNPNRFRFITGINGLDKVLRGIKAAIDVGLNPIKINYVVLKGINDDEFWNIVEYTRSIGAILQVIELEPIGVPRDIFTKYYISISTFENMIKERVIRKNIRYSLHARPIYTLDNGAIIEFVKWFCNPEFCMHCTRLRLTPDGKLKTCIISGGEVDLKHALRPIPKPYLIRELIIKANYLRKPYNKLNYLNYYSLIKQVMNT